MHNNSGIYVWCFSVNKKILILCKQGSPFDGVGGEENPKKDSYEDSIFEDEGKLMVNGENSAPRQEYHSSEIETFKVARDEADAPAGKIAYLLSVSGMFFIR